MPTIGRRIRDRRLQLGLSADQVAEKLGKNRATVYRYESDDIENLPLSIVAPLAEILMVSPAFIMGWDESTISPKSTHGTKHTQKLRALLSEKLSNIDQADLEDACSSDGNCQDIVDFVSSERDVSFEEACRFAEYAGISIDNDVLGNAPAHQDERTSEVIRLYSGLDSAHQQTLLHVLRGLLADQATHPVDQE